jgi:hypothetical protein
MKARALVLALAVAAGGQVACGLDLGGGKHPAVTAFEAFYWKLQKGDLAAAGALVVPGSEAERTLATRRAAAADAEVARGFALDVSREPDGELAGRPAIRLHGEATVTVDPAGYASPFGVPVPHQVEARLVEEAGSWRVAAFRDTVVAH